jgi:hypothetical protein
MSSILISNKLRIAKIIFLVSSLFIIKCEFNLLSLKTLMSEAKDFEQVEDYFSKGSMVLNIY